MPAHDRQHTYTPGCSCSQYCTCEHAAGHLITLVPTHTATHPSRDLLFIYCIPAHQLCVPMLAAHHGMPYFKLYICLSLLCAPCSQPTPLGEAAAGSRSRRRSVVVDDMMSGASGGFNGSFPSPPAGDAPLGGPRARRRSVVLDNSMGSGAFNMGPSSMVPPAGEAFAAGTKTRRKSVVIDEAGESLSSIVRTPSMLDSFDALCQCPYASIPR